MADFYLPENGQTIKQIVKKFYSKMDYFTFRETYIKPKFSVKWENEFKKVSHVAGHTMFSTIISFKDDPFFINGKYNEACATYFAELDRYDVPYKVYWHGLDLFCNSDSFGRNHFHVVWLTPKVFSTGRWTLHDKMQSDFNTKHGPEIRMTSRKIKCPMLYQMYLMARILCKVGTTTSLTWNKMQDKIEGIFSDYLEVPYSTYQQEVSAAVSLYYQKLSEANLEWLHLPLHFADKVLSKKLDRLIALTELEKAGWTIEELDQTYPKWPNAM